MALSPAADDMLVFDRALVRRHRDRAATGFGAHDFLVAEVADRLVERLGDVNRRFPRALDLGAHDGTFGRMLAGTGRTDLLVSADLSPALVSRAPAPRLAADEEALPFADGAFDLVASCLSLHWVNDLPGTLIQVRRVLAPDGLFVAALLGGETLIELRQAFLEAEALVEGGASPRVSPMADLRDAAGLLQRAGFAMPVADVDTIDVTYGDPFALLRELRGMGETNAIKARRRTPLRRATLMAMAEAYGRRFAGPDGRVRATFQVLYLAGWAPGPGQPQPKRPGSANARLADALGTVEKPAGEKAGS
jgi:SAM-dependent methyltransferase